MKGLQLRSAIAFSAIACGFVLLFSFGRALGDAPSEAGSPEMSSEYPTSPAAFDEWATNEWVPGRTKWSEIKSILGDGFVEHRDYRILTGGKTAEFNYRLASLGIHDHPKGTDLFIHIDLQTGNLKCAGIHDAPAD